MATKKQKRQAALKRHEEFMAQYREEGLTAQRFDQERRRRNAEKAKLADETKTKREATTEAVQKLLGAA